MSEGFIDRQRKFVTNEAKSAIGDYFKDEEERLHAELRRIKETWLKKKEDDLNYLKEAFYYQYNLIPFLGSKLHFGGTATLRFEFLPEPAPTVAFTAGAIGILALHAAARSGKR